MPYKRFENALSNKVRLEVDPHNRLVMAETGKRSDVRRHRHVLDGRFKIDKNNELSYHVKSPYCRDRDVPHQLRLKGKWTLTEDHNIELKLDKWGRQTFGDKLTLEGRIVEVKKNSLAFSVSATTKAGLQTTYTVNLAGTWQADKNNRLTFSVKREKQRRDILTFRGAWEINKNCRIVYKYEKALLITKKKELHTLEFKGHWDIKDKARLFYVMDARSDSVMSFKTGLGIFSGKEIKYRIDIAVKDTGLPIERTLKLKGEWKVKKNIGLTFETTYKAGEAHSMVFGADAKLTSRDTVSLKIKNERGKDLGGELELSRRLLKGDGDAFLRLLASRNETKVVAGVGFRW